MKIFGIDVGMKGALTVMDNGDSIIDIIEFNKGTERDICDAIIEHTRDCTLSEVMAFIENVHSMPKQGVASSFKFGDGCGFLRGLLTALKIPYEKVTPQTWQKALGCLSHGDKNITKAKAQQLYPSRKITHATADSILIAVYGMRKMQNKL